MDSSPEDVSTRLAGSAQPIAELVIAAQPILSTPEAVEPSLPPRRRNAPRTTEMLCHRHGEAKARKIAGREQKQARQKRSRAQFAFWADVGAEIELRRRIAPDVSCEGALLRAPTEG
jgi:hypothetical protein